LLGKIIFLSDGERSGNTRTHTLSLLSLSLSLLFSLFLNVLALVREYSRRVSRRRVKSPDVLTGIALYIFKSITFRLYITR